jgi:hypothetical protein
MLDQARANTARAAPSWLKEMRLLRLSTHRPVILNIYPSINAVKHRATSASRSESKLEIDVDDIIRFTYCWTTTDRVARDDAS